MSSTDTIVDVLLAGWATKEGTAFKTWKRRFFVLRRCFPGETFQDKSWKGPTGSARNIQGATHILLYYRSLAQAQSTVYGATGAVPICEGKTTVQREIAGGKKCLAVYTDGFDRVLHVIPEGNDEEWIAILTKLSPNPETASLRRMTLGAKPVKHADIVKDDDDEPVVTTPATTLGKHPDSIPGLQITVDFLPEDRSVLSKLGDMLTVFYTGKIDTSSKSGTPGDIFDSTDSRGPHSFQFGMGKVIKGWDLGLRGMVRGEKRTLIIGPEYAYGLSGSGGIIPGDATLHFSVELVGINTPQSKIAPINQEHQDISETMQNLVEKGNVALHKEHCCDQCHDKFGMMTPIYGPMYSSKEYYGNRENQYDLCQSCFDKQALEAKKGFYVVKTPTSDPVPWTDTNEGICDLKVASKAQEHSAAPCEIDVDKKLSTPLQMTIKKIGRDPALTKDEKESMATLVPPLQQYLEELHAISIALFVDKKRFRIPTTAAEQENRLGSTKIDLDSLSKLWSTELGALPDGRSLKDTFLKCKAQARQVLDELDSAVQRTWGIAFEEFRKYSSAALESEIPQVIPTPRETMQPVPDGRFRNVAMLSTHWGANDVRPEMTALFNKFVEDAYGGKFGSKWLRYSVGYSQLSSSGSPEQLQNLVLASSEMDMDLSKTCHTIWLGLATQSGFSSGNEVYHLYLSVRARYANLTFIEEVKKALSSGFSNYTTVGVEVRECDIKGNSRRMSKEEEYRREKLEEPAVAHVKDILRLTLAVPKIEHMIKCANAIKKAFHVLSLKNRLESRATRDVLMIVRLKDGFLAEVQIHLKAILQIKKHTHKPYKVDRLELADCPVLGALIDFPGKRAELLTDKSIVLTTSYAK